MDEVKEETKAGSEKPMSEGREAHEEHGPLPHKPGPNKTPDERMRQIIASVALSVWGFCTVVSALRYFMTGQSGLLEWLIYLVMGAVIAYYFWRQRGNAGPK